MFKKATNKNVLNSKNLWSLIFKMALPATTSGLATSFIYFSDSIMASNADPSLALEISSGIGIGISLLSIVTTFVILFSSGAAIRYALLLSRGKEESAKYTSGTSFTSTIIFSIFVSLILLFIAGPLVNLQTGSQNLIYEYGKKYLQMTIFWIPFFAIAADLTSYLRIHGLFKSMVFLNCSTLFLNLLLNFLFLKTSLDPVIAVGLSTMFLQIYKVVFCFFLIVWIKKRQEIFIFNSFKYYKINFKILGVTTLIGLPLITRYTLLNINNLLIATQLSQMKVPDGINVSSGEYYTPIVSVYNQVYSIFINLLNGLAAGAGTVIIYNFGKKNFTQTKKSVKIFGVYTLICLTLILALSLVFSEELLLFFNVNPSSEPYINEVFSILVLRIFFLGLSFVQFTFFLNTYQIKKAFAAIFTHTLLIYIPLTFILTNFASVKVGLLSFLLADMIYFICASIPFIYDYLNLTKLFYNKEIDIIALQKAITKMRYINAQNILVRKEKSFTRNVSEVKDKEDILKKIKHINKASKDIEAVSKIMQLKRNNSFFQKYDKKNANKKDTKKVTKKQISYLDEDKITIVDTYEFRSKYSNQKNTNHKYKK